MLNRSAYRLYRVLSSAQYRVFRRFTKAGLLLLTALILVAFLAMDIDQTSAHETFSLLACLLLVSMLTAPFFRARFAVRRNLPRFGSVGEPLAYQLILQNLTVKPQHDLVVLENLADPRPDFREFADALRAARETRSFRLTTPTPKRRGGQVQERSAPSLTPHGQVEVPMELIPFSRGPLWFRGTAIARADPFGLFRGFVNVPLAQSVLILPKRYPLPPIALPGNMKYQQGGVALASSVGQSEEFVSLRDYRPGDPMRHIHWKSWAKTGRPIVKEFLDEFFVRHALVLDTFAGPGKEEAFEEVVSIAASFACTLRTQESLLDLMFVGPDAFCFTSGRSLAHTDQMLEILAAVRPCREKPFAALSDLVAGHASSLSGCICVFLEWDEPRRDLVRRMKSMAMPMLVLLVTATDGSELLSRIPAEDRPERFHVLTVGKIAEGLRKLSGTSGGAGGLR